MFFFSFFFLLLLLFCPLTKVYQFSLALAYTSFKQWTNTCELDTWVIFNQRLKLDTIRIVSRQKKKKIKWEIFFFFNIERSYLLGVNWKIIAEILKTHLIDHSSCINITPMNGFVMKLSTQFECLLYKLSSTNSLDIVFLVF